jgi:hypothetical protein
MWPAALTEVPATSMLNRRGRERYKQKYRAVRAEAGFVIDLDSPGEDFFCDGHNGILVLVDSAGIDEALKDIKAQGAIDFQPALDWLEANNLRERVARPEPVEASEVPVARMKKDALEAMCDEMHLAHGTVKEMRAAIASSLESAE